MTPEKRKKLGEMLQQFFAEAGDADVCAIFEQEWQAWRRRRDAPIPRPLMPIERDSKYDRERLVRRATELNIPLRGYEWGGTERIIRQIQKEEKDAGRPVPPRERLFEWYGLSTKNNPKE
jgi:hypothetical protein